jgi:hypothetical protein
MENRARKMRLEVPAEPETPSSTIENASTSWLVDPQTGVIQQIDEDQPEVNLLYFFRDFFLNQFLVMFYRFSLVLFNFRCLRKKMKKIQNIQLKNRCLLIKMKRL